MDCLTKNCKQTRPNFRMAYHANDKRIAKVLGPSVGAEVKKARKQMEALSKDVDVYVFPDKGEKPFTDNLMIYIKSHYQIQRTKF